MKRLNIEQVYGHYTSVSLTCTSKSSRLQIFFRIGALKNFSNFTCKQLPETCNFIKKRLKHRCFLVKFEKFLRTPFFTEHLRWLFLDFIRYPVKSQNHIATTALIFICICSSKACRYLSFFVVMPFTLHPLNPQAFINFIACDNLLHLTCYLVFLGSAAILKVIDG